MTEQFFLDKIQTILATNGGLNGSTTFVVNNKLEAKQAIQRITLVCKELRLVKKEVAGVIAQAKLNFTGQRSNIGHDWESNLEGLFLGLRFEGHHNAERRAYLRVQQAAAISPYDRLKLRIDSIITELDINKEKIKLMNLPN